MSTVSATDVDRTLLQPFRALAEPVFAVEQVVPLLVAGGTADGHHDDWLHDFLELALQVLVLVEPQQVALA